MRTMALVDCRNCGLTHATVDREDQIMWYCCFILPWTWAQCDAWTTWTKLRISQETDEERALIVQATFGSEALHQVRVGKILLQRAKSERGILRPLRGTPKQISWATRIRGNIRQRLDNVKDWPEHPEDFSKAVPTLIRLVNESDQAHFFIEHKEISLLNGPGMVYALGGIYGTMPFYDVSTEPDVDP